MGKNQKTEKYPFARAKVERILKAACPDAEISPRVRLAFNIWLGKMAENVSEELAKVSHRTITEQDFQNVISKYEFAGDLKKERERISNRMKELGKEVERFKGKVEDSIVHREEGAQDLIFARVADQYKQEYEEAVYVKDVSEAEADPEE